MHTLFITALLFLLFGLATLTYSIILRRRSGLPGRIIAYSHMGAEAETPPVLFSERYRVAGRPDYLVREGRHLIPVEVKSGAAPARPYHSHLLQLAVYCLLTEEHYRRPPYGVICYSDRSFHVPYSRQLRRDLLHTLEEMRRLIRCDQPPDVREDPRRCRRCGFIEDCQQVLF